MNIVLWVLQVLLAVAFFAHGWLFLSPPAAIAEQMNASLPRWFQLFLGVAEVRERSGERLVVIDDRDPLVRIFAEAGRGFQQAIPEAVGPGSQGGVSLAVAGVDGQQTGQTMVNAHAELRR